MTRTLVGLAAVTSVAVLAATHSQSRDTHHLETVTAIAVPNAAEAAANRSAQPPFSHDVEAHSRGVGPVTMLTTGSTKPRADNAATLASEKPDRNAQAALVRGIQAALFDARCYKGRINGVWSEKTRAAMSGFVGRVNAQLPVERPTFVLLTLIENQRGVRCPEPVRVVRQTTRDDIASATPQPPPPPVRAPARPAKTDQGSVKAAAEEDTMSASAQSPAQVQAQTQAKARVERNAGWVANSWRAAVAAAASRSGETGADENAHNTAQPKAAAPARADVVAAAQPKPPTKAVSAREAAPSGAADQKRGAADQKQGARLVVATARPSAYRPSMRVGNRPVDIVTVRPTATEAAIATKAGERVSNDAPRVAAATPPSGRDAADIDTADETHDGDPSVSIALPVRAPEPPPRVRTAALRSTDADVAGSPRQPVTAPATRQTHTPAPDSRAAAQPVPRTRTEQADRRSQRLKRLRARRKLSERRAARRARIRRARAAARRRARAQARLRISKVQRIKRRRKRFTPARFFARVGNDR